VTEDEPTTGTATARAPARVLVTGASGFVGRHLVAELAGRGMAVTAAARRRPPAAGGPAGVARVGGDLSRDGAAAELVRRSRPGVVVHLAAATRSTGRPDGLGGFAGTLATTSALVEAMTREVPGARLIVVSSSAVYGVPDRLPVTEDAPVRPVTEYGVSKAAQELVALRARWAGQLDVVVVRAFNLAGPGLPPHLLAGTVVAQVLAAPPDQPAVLELGNLASRRDYVDVRDLATALAEVAGLERPPPVLNVASGRSWSGAEVVERVAALSGRAVEVRSVAERTQAGDVPEQVGSAACLAGLTGWRPVHTFEQTLRAMLEAGEGRPR
jgi:GDP-4-dehydro-6-deoxy-D-mannose reductase